MGGNKSKIITSNFCLTCEEACKNLEQKLNNSIKTDSAIIVTLAPEEMKANTMLSPRTRLARIALARINGKDYNVVFLKQDDKIIASITI